ncbi:MAG: hypothetical protein ABI557_19865 [Aureliella sp.]
MPKSIVASTAVLVELLNRSQPLFSFFPNPDIESASLILAVRIIVLLPNRTVCLTLNYEARERLLNFAKFESASNLPHEGESNTSSFGPK